MSSAAKKLSSTPPRQGHRTTIPGPTSACSELYGPGDLEDFAAIQEFRQRPGENWLTAQRTYNELAGVTRVIHNDKFRYHWNRRCACWTDEQRNA